MRIENIRRFYEYHYEKSSFSNYYNPKIPHRKHLLHHIHYAIRKYGRLSKDKVALDVGCSEGIFASYISEFAKLVIGIDLNIFTIRRAHRNNKVGNVGFVLASAEHQPFRESVFDFVFCNHLMEHLVNDSLGCKEIGRVLNHMGIALISVPTHDSTSISGVLSRILGLFVKSQNPVVSLGDILSLKTRHEHLHLYSIKAISSLIVQSGLTITSIYTYGFVFPFYQMIGNRFPVLFRLYDFIGRRIPVTSESPLIAAAKHKQ